MPKRRYALALLAAALLLCATALAGEEAAPQEESGKWPADAPTGFHKKVKLDVMAKHPRAYYHIAIPEKYTREKQWPLFILLHGGPHGAGADNMVPFFKGGLMKRGVISVYPMALEEQLLAWNYPHEMAYILQIIRQVGTTYRIDPKRIYLTGHSMGGGGAWAQGAVLRDTWAGIGPMSGWFKPTPAPDVKLYKGLPIYILHGEKDRAVPVRLSRMADSALKKIGHKDYVYRELEGVGHGVFAPWKKVGAPEIGKMVAWLMAHERPKPANLKAAMVRLAKWGKAFGWTPTGSPVGSYEDDGDKKDATKEAKER